MSKLLSGMNRSTPLLRKDIMTQASDKPFALPGSIPNPALREAATDLAGRNYRLIPLYAVRGGRCACHNGAACDRPGGHPITEGGMGRPAPTRSKFPGGGRRSPT